MRSPSKHPFSSLRLNLRIDDTQHCALVLKGPCVALVPKLSRRKLDESGHCLPPTGVNENKVTPPRLHVVEGHPVGRVNRHRSKPITNHSPNTDGVAAI